MSIWVTELNSLWNPNGSFPKLTGWAGWTVILDGKVIQQFSNTQLSFLYEHWGLVEVASRIPCKHTHTNADHKSQVSYLLSCSHLFPHDMSLHGLPHYCTLILIWRKREQGEPTPGLFASPSFQRPHVCNRNPKMLATNFHHTLSDWPCWRKRHSPRDLHWWKSGERVLPAPKHP